MFRRARAIWWSTVFSEREEASVTAISGAMVYTQCYSRMSLQSGSGRAGPALARNLKAEGVTKSPAWEGKAITW